MLLLLRLHHKMDEGEEGEDGEEEEDEEVDETHLNVCSTL